MFALIAHASFFILLLIAMRELSRKAIVTFIILWGVAYLGSGFFAGAGYIFMAAVAMLDIALILAIFGGNIPVR